MSWRRNSVQDQHIIDDYEYVLVKMPKSKSCNFKADNSGTCTDHVEALLRLNNYYGRNRNIQVECEVYQLNGIILSDALSKVTKEVADDIRARVEKVSYKETIADRMASMKLSGPSDEKVPDKYRMHYEAASDEGSSDSESEPDECRSIETVDVRAIPRPLSCSLELLKGQYKPLSMEYIPKELHKSLMSMNIPNFPGMSKFTHRCVRYYTNGDWTMKKLILMLQHRIAYYRAILKAYEVRSHYEINFDMSRLFHGIGNNFLGSYGQPLLTYDLVILNQHIVKLNSIAKDMYCLEQKELDPFLSILVKQRVLNLMETFESETFPTILDFSDCIGEH